MEEIKKKKKRQKRTKNELRYYFDNNTQSAIVLFQKESSKKEKDRLYVTEILPAFEKLVENLINIYKFTGLHDSYDNLKNDCITFLFETIHKFDEGRGTTAFSYFNVVAKNWLIIKTKQKVSKVKKSVSLDDTTGLTPEEIMSIEHQQTIHSCEEEFTKLEQKAQIKDIFNDLLLNARTENEVSCINSITTILDNIDDIDFINKNAIQLYIKELTGLSQKQLSSVFHSLRKNYKKVKSDPKYAK